jgi:hypothetical protein
MSLMRSDLNDSLEVREFALENMVRGPRMGQVQGLALLEKFGPINIGQVCLFAPLGKEKAVQKDGIWSFELSS